MKQSKAMAERIRRSTILFKELGYELMDTERTDEGYSAAIAWKGNIEGGFFIDAQSRFLEIAYTFSFSSELGAYVREKLEEMLKVCYDFGCYFNLQHGEEEISFSLFSKIYYTGLSYYSLRDTLRDFKECVAETTELLRICGREEEG